MELLIVKNIQNVILATILFIWIHQGLKIYSRVHEEILYKHPWMTSLQALFIIKQHHKTTSTIFSPSYHWMYLTKHRIIYLRRKFNCDQKIKEQNTIWNQFPFTYWRPKLVLSHFKEQNSIFQLIFNFKEQNTISILFDSVLQRTECIWETYITISEFASFYNY